MTGFQSSGKYFIFTISSNICFTSALCLSTSHNVSAKSSKKSLTLCKKVFCSLVNFFFQVIAFSLSQYVKFQVLNQSAKLFARISSASYALTWNNFIASSKTLSYCSFHTYVLNIAWNNSWGGVLSFTISVKVITQSQYAQ